MFWYGNKQLLRIFGAGNVIVAGHKGNGKDLLFQYVISAREKKGAIHSSNIKYTQKTTIRPISFYKFHNISFKDFIESKFDNISTEDKKFVEKEDYYISDVGTALPAQYGKKLEKLYPTFPLVYALSRHLADFNIHCNVQNFGRVWDKLREQGDYYVYCEKARVLFRRIAFQRYIIYDRYQSALANIQPYKCRRRIFGLVPPTKEDLSRANEHNARYGSIRRYYMWHILPKVHYDTRIFHKLIYGKDAPNVKNTRKNKK